MSTSIRVSYERPEELERIIHKLGASIERTKLQPAKGRYLLAYLRLKPLSEKPEDSKP